ncbi:MAG: cysteine synthase A [Alphaproteobacteria bacterium]|nr:cysteine synthase A [Alphaproteobacteria bacterium]
MPLTFSARGKVYNDITETIGGTPLVKLNALAKDEGCHATVLAKLEFFNPLASSKDRAAMSMIDDAEQKGILKPGGTIVEATSGNTGIGLAFIATVKGYKLILTMPENMSLERRKLLAFLGAKIILTPAADGMGGAVKKAEEIVRQTPGSIMAKQFDNPANPAAHVKTTAEEIWADTQGHVDAFAAGIGTGGTVQGVAQGLKAHNAAIHIIGAEPASSPVLTKGTSGPHKIQGIGANFVPSILDRSILDEIMDIGDDESLVFARRLARQEGIMAGISSGAAVAAAIRWAKRPETKGKTIVALLPDTAERYLSSELFDI